MGNFYVNFAVRGREPSQVADSLRTAGREAIVAPLIQGITTFYDRAADFQDDEEINNVARTVSNDLGCPVLAFLNHDDDILKYWLFTAGELIDTYDSCPGYFTGDEHALTGGNSVELCSAFGVRDQIAEVEKTLHHSSYAFAFERHTTLASLLGLPSEHGLMSYSSLVSVLDNAELAEIHHIDPRQFIRIEPKTPARNEEAADAKHVTLGELEQETSHLPFLSWIGSDGEFHYFATRDGDRYRVDRSEWQLPAHMAGFMPRPGDGMALFVTVKDGKITTPDPKTMSNPFGDDLDPPLE